MWPWCSTTSKNKHMAATAALTLTNDAVSNFLLEHCGQQHKTKLSHWKNIHFLWSKLLDITKGEDIWTCQSCHSSFLHYMKWSELEENRRRKRRSKRGNEINLRGGHAGGEEEDGGEDDDDGIVPGLIQKARLFPSPFHGHTQVNISSFTHRTVF